MSDSAEILIFTQSNALLENRPTFRRIQTGLLCRARSNIFIRGLRCQSSTKIKMNLHKKSFHIFCESKIEELRILFKFGFNQ